MKNKLIMKKKQSRICSYVAKINPDWVVTRETFDWVILKYKDFAYKFHDKTTGKSIEFTIDDMVELRKQFYEMIIDAEKFLDTE